MTPITDNEALAAFCEKLKGVPAITVDTEFLRDNTYWPKLCLLQIAGPEDAATIDPLAPGLELAPVTALFDDPNMVKVLHSGRQDLEIFYQLNNRLPAPVFDTQIAAMVCGFGESVGYDTLVRKTTGASIDKGSRFTDWARRPLSDAQVDYALGDVTHLRDVYKVLCDMLDKNGRRDWIEEEMAWLTAEGTYRTDPEESWRRLKIRSRDRLLLATARELAAWRDREAQRRDVPRNRVLRDEQLLDIAARRPETEEALSRTRGFRKETASSRHGQGILEAIQRAKALPPDQRPDLPEKKDQTGDLGPVIDLLRVLLKGKCQNEGVAQKLVANGEDLESIAANDQADVPALKGWRRKLFGEEALRLKNGGLALAIIKNKIVEVPLEG